MSQAYLYDESIAAFTTGGLRWQDDDVRVMLLSSDYQPDQVADATVDDLRRFEISASGSYERGGAPISGRRVERSEFGGEVRLLAESVVWSQVTAEFRFAVVYERGSGQLVAYSDMGSQRVTDAAVTLSYGTSGVAAFMLATPKGI